MSDVEEGDIFRKALTKTFDDVFDPPTHLVNYRSDYKWTPLSVIKEANNEH